jgi:hypothetical protein
MFIIIYNCLFDFNLFIRLVFTEQQKLFSAISFLNLISCSLISSIFMYIFLINKENVTVEAITIINKNNIKSLYYLNFDNYYITFFII